MNGCQFAVSTYCRLKPRNNRITVILIATMMPFAVADWLMPR